MPSRKGSQKKKKSHPKQRKTKIRGGEEEREKIQKNQPKPNHRKRKMRHGVLQGAAASRAAPRARGTPAPALLTLSAALPSTAPRALPRHSSNPGLPQRSPGAAAAPTALLTRAHGRAAGPSAPRDGAAPPPPALLLRLLRDNRSGIPSPSAPCAAPRHFPPTPPGAEPPPPKRAELTCEDHGLRRPRWLRGAACGAGWLRPCLPARLPARRRRLASDTGREQRAPARPAPAPPPARPRPRPRSAPPPRPQRPPSAGTRQRTEW